MLSSFSVIAQDASNETEPLVDCSPALFGIIAQVREAAAGNNCTQ